ncbi:hypothetical protein [Streptomyces sp. NPDC059378]|uniref:hypothetical protein n=1 Tax=Streptomyces sp. NPDC059378 TaxID=3346815 RepID=UPI0036BB3A5F
MLHLELYQRWSCEVALGDRFFLRNKVSELFDLQRRSGQGAGPVLRVDVVLP